SYNLIPAFVLPDMLWPNPDHQKTNHETIRNILSRQDQLEHMALEAGFTSAALSLMQGVFSTWKKAASGGEPFWPQTPASQSLLEKFAARSGTNLYALALIKGPEEKGQRWKTETVEELRKRLPKEGVWLT